LNTVLILKIQIGKELAFFQAL